MPLLKRKPPIYHKNLSLHDFLQLSIYADQRETSEEKIRTITESFKKRLREGKSIQFITDPCVAYHPSKKDVFSCKHSKIHKVSKVLFDGQHRLQALRRVQNEPNFKKVMGKEKIWVKMFACKTDAEVHSLFLDLNRSRSATGAELKQNKSSFNANKIITDTINILKQKYASCISDVEDPKRTTFGRFYYKKLRLDMIKTDHFVEWLEEKKMNVLTLFQNIKKLELTLQKDLNPNFLSAGNKTWKKRFEPKLNCILSCIHPNAYGEVIIEPLLKQ